MAKNKYTQSGKAYRRKLEKFLNKKDVIPVWLKKIREEKT